MVSGPWPAVPNFLSRTRGFGKTLPLDTIQTIFQGERELFSGLEIGRRLGGNREAFPVIRLSVNTAKSGQDLFGPSLFSAVKMGQNGSPGKRRCA
ncbi:MAG: AAA family ATPase [Deltaproteobacteria bacterium]|nr:AAA family ATPase [Deltaproteobacteria bacterium]